MTAVLSDAEIERRATKDELIVKATFRESSLQPSSYDVTIAKDGLITPTGTDYAPGGVGAHPRKVILYPGDTALFSTRELFRLPHDVAGNISIKNRLAADGLTLLSGMLIDPGYGFDQPADAEKGCRLYMHVANIGRDPIVLQPDRQQVARVQFLPVAGGESANRKDVPPSRWVEQTQASLGFLAELKQLKEKTERASYRSEQVVLLGFIVLGASIVGITLSTILSITLNTKLMREIHRNLPHTVSGKALLAALCVGVAGVLLAAAMILKRPHRPRPRRRLTALLARPRRRSSALVRER